MSYPSITRILSEHFADPNQATDADLRAALYEAFQQDLPLGYARLMQAIEQYKATGERALLAGDPKTDEAKQLIRLVGADVPRSIFEEKHGVALAFYNCHVVAVANSRAALQLSAKEQIHLQDPSFIDC